MLPPGRRMANGSISYPTERFVLLWRRRGDRASRNRSLIRRQRFIKRHCRKGRGRRSSRTTSCTIRKRRRKTMRGRTIRTRRKKRRIRTQKKRRKNRIKRKTRTRKRRSPRRTVKKKKRKSRSPSRSIWKAWQAACRKFRSRPEIIMVYQRQRSISFGFGEKIRLNQNQTCNNSRSATTLRNPKRLLKTSNTTNFRRTERRCSSTKAIISTC